MKQVSSDSAGIKLAIESIKNGGIVIFPTDTVYGIGCDPYNENAVKKFMKSKTVIVQNHYQFWDIQNEFWRIL